MTTATLNRTSKIKPKKIRMETEEADLHFTFFPGHVELKIKSGGFLLDEINFHIGRFEWMLEEFQTYYKKESKTK